LHGTIIYVNKFLLVGSFSKQQTFTDIKGKGKAVPLQAWTGPEGSRRSRLPDF
jgi:hypothetical protein